MTVKLPPALEDSLRRASAALGRPASELIRDALHGDLAGAVEPDVSAYELGKDLFGAHAGPADLSIRRKAAASEVWGDKHARRARPG